MRLWLTIVAVGLLLHLAVRNGGAPERYAAFTIAAAFALNIVVIAIGGPAEFQKFESVRFAIEVGVFFVFTTIAIFANRLWPICLSALQLIVLTAHAAKISEIEGLPGVYWGMTVIPSYLQLAVLLGGIFSHSRRESLVGIYRDWRRT